MIYLILLLSLGLRLIALNQSLWLDEAVQVWASKLPINQFFRQFLPGDFNPPAYYLFLHYWIKIFGDAEIWVRLPSVFAGSLSILLLLEIAKLANITKQESRKFLGLLLATSPLHIYYSQEARPYLFSSFFLLLTSFYFLRSLNKPSWTNLFLFTISLLFAAFSHFLIFFAVLILVLVLLLSLRKFSFKKLLKISTPFLVLGIVFLFYFPIFQKQLSVSGYLMEQYPGWQKIIGGFDLKAALLLPVKFVIGRISFTNKTIYAVIAGFSVLLFWGTALLGLIKYCKQKSFRQERILVYSILVAPFVLGAVISFYLPIFSYFRFFFLLPFFYLAVVIGWETLKGKKLISFLMISLNLVFSGIYLFNPNFHRENWRGAVQWLVKENPDRKPVLILSQISKPFEYYYLDQKQVVYINDPSNFTGKNLEKETKLFLISYGLPIFDLEDKIRKGLKTVNYELKNGESFNRVGVEEWERLKK